MIIDTKAAGNRWPEYDKSYFILSVIKIYGNAINFTEWRLCRHSEAAENRWLFACFAVGWGSVYR